MAQSVYLSLVLLAAVVGTAVAFFAWLQGDQPGARPLALFVLTASFWAVAEGLSVALPGYFTVRFWTQVGLTLSAVIPVTWLATVLEYAGHDRWLTRRRLAVLLSWPAVFVFLVWTNDGHALVWSAGVRNFVGGYSVFAMDFGLAFWAHQLYSYLLVAAGGLLLVGMILRSNGLYRSQSTALLVAIAVPMVGNALYIFRVLPAGLDPTGVSYVLTGLVLATAMFRSQLLRISPAVRELGREEALSELDDAVFILDENDRIVDVNPAASRLVGAAGDALGTPLSVRFPELADALDADEATIRLDSEGRVRYYDVQATRLSRGYGNVSGRLLSLRDVTDQRRREQRLDVLNRLLRHNIRNELNVVRGNVELARAEVEGDAADRLDSAIETIDTVVDRSDKVGRLSRLFEADIEGDIDLAAHLESDLRPTIAAFPDADIALSLPDSLWVAAGPSVTVAVDELVRNGVEHNDGDWPHVTVGVDGRASDDQFVVLTVADDGPGIDEQERAVIEAGRETPLEHGSGVGLWLANWVVERHGGTLSFENTGGGCRVSVRLPRGTGGETDGDETGDSPAAENA